MRPRWAVPTLVVASLGCLMGGAVVGTLMGAARDRARDLPGTYASARELGIAVNLEDLKRTVPPDEDATPLLEEGSRQWAALGTPIQDALEESLARAIGRTANIRTIHRLKEQLAQHRGLLETYRNVGEKPSRSVDEVEHWREKKIDTAPESIARGVRLWTGKAVVEAREGYVAQAIEAIDVAISIARHLKAEPTYLGYLRQSTAEIEIQRAMVITAEANARDPRMPEHLRNLQARLGPAPSLREAMKGELALVLVALAADEKNELANVPLADMVTDFARADLTAIFSRVVQELPEEPEDLPAASRAIERMRERAEDAPFFGGYAKGYRRAIPRLADVVTRRRLAMAAAALLEYRNREGAYPETLPDLGENGIDPHSGTRMLYLRRGSEAVVYSVGRDGEDNGGVERTRANDWRRDIIFRLP